MAEYYPAILYIEQMLRVYPLEVTDRLRVSPAFEESFMKIIEVKDNEWATHKYSDYLTGTTYILHFSFNQTHFAEFRLLTLSSQLSESLLLYVVNSLFQWF